MHSLGNCHKEVKNIHKQKPTDSNEGILGIERTIIEENIWTYMELRNKLFIMIKLINGGLHPKSAPQRLRLAGVSLNPA